MTYRIEIYGYSTQAIPMFATDEAEGWRMEDPPGWIQIIEAGDVTFLSLKEVRVVVVPNLGDEGMEPIEPIPDPGYRE